MKTNKYLDNIPFEEKIYNQYDALVNIDKNSIELLYVLSNISFREAIVWGKGKLTVYFYFTDLIPFIIIDYGNGIRFKSSINVWQTKEIDRNDWFNHRSNIVKVVFFDDNSLECVSERIIPIKIDLRLRLAEMLRSQLNYSLAEISNQIKIAEKKYTVDKMIEEAERMMKFTPSKYEMV